MFRRQTLSRTTKDLPLTSLTNLELARHAR